MPIGKELMISMWHPVQRLVFPRDRHLQPLYVTALTSSGATADEELATTRVAARVPTRRRLSFNTYFGALFESHWLAAATISRWQLVVEVCGSGRLDVFRAMAGKGTVRVGGQEFSGNERPISIWVAPAHSRNAGTRLFFDIEAFGSAVTVGNAVWSAEVAASRPVRLAIGFCTYNREPYVLDNIRTLMSEQDLWLTVQRLIIVEQSENGGLKEAIAGSPEIGEKIKIIRQDNFGGAGGFARVMLEALREDSTTHLLLMDDDVRIEPECILRTAALFAIASEPVALGGQMLRFDKPMIMHEAGATLSPKTLRVVPRDREQEVCRNETLSHLSSVRRNDYVAWFYFGVSLEILQRAGLPWPFFIVFDDVEYGLRLARLGISSVTIPGIAVWHETGEDRDARWKTYYYQRNVLILCSLYRLPGRQLSTSARFFRHWMRRLLKRDIAQPLLACDAVRDYLRGPPVLDAKPTQRALAVKCFCEATRHRQGRFVPLVAAAGNVIWLSVLLLVQSRRVEARWRAVASEVTSTKWWHRNLQLWDDSALGNLPSTHGY